MDPHVHPDLAAALRGRPARHVTRRNLPLVRLMFRLPGRPRPVAGTSVTVHPDGPRRLRQVRRDGSAGDAALLWIHGGGYVLGSPAREDRHASRLARDLDVVVVSADYRLAPEHPFPAALDDCRAAWRWVQDRSEDLGVDPARVVVAGVSAGGGLAAALVQRIHDEGGPQPLGQLLVYPMLDDRTAARRELDDRYPEWTNRSNLTGWSAYLGREPGAGAPPEYAAPGRRADLAGLPPAWLGVGTLDLFHDEDVDYARRLTAAGVPTTLDVVPGAFHGFDGTAPDALVSQAFERRRNAWLREILEG
ncbi:MAG: alpha/beta hydrolase [Kineosporiaceae bacterium]